MSSLPPAPDGFCPSPLDPDDWSAFSAEAHRLLDTCIEHLRLAREHPWQPLASSDRAALRLGDAVEGGGTAALADDLARHVLPFATGNTHPRFFGWVHGTGLASGLMAELVAATMNSNCGGRDHGAIAVEREVIDWCKRTIGFPDSASGVMVTGTSQATLVALAAARLKALGAESRKNGIQGAPRLSAYAVEGVHNAAQKALELLGLGGSALRTVRRDASHRMDLSALDAAIERDRAAGWQPFCVIGTAGSVDQGYFDDFNALADYCAARQLWLHVDGAFGVWARLADAPWRDLASGIERADSLVFDFHKWMYVQYDCGVALIRDEAVHRAAFAARPAYLARQDQGLGGGEPWFCDYGIDLSRGFRALKVWSALRAYGREAFGRAITRNCELAARMARCVEAAPELTLAGPVTLNVCCFSAAPPDLEPAAQDALNARITHVLQLAGDAVFSTTTLAGRTVIRAAIVNHRTCEADIDVAITAVLQARARLLTEMP